MCGLLGSICGKYESPLLEGGFLPSCRGIDSSSSSVESVGTVRLVMLAADDAGSNEGTLERIDGSETLDRVRNGHLGGESGETGVSVLRLARGVSSNSGEFNGEVLLLDNGERLSDPFLSLPFPRTAFLNDPFLLRLSCELEVPLVYCSPSPSMLSFSTSPLLRKSLPSRLADIDRLCPDGLFGRSCCDSSSIMGNGIDTSASGRLAEVSLITGIRRHFDTT